MDIFDTYATDEKAELEGVWVPFKKGSRVKVARLGNKNYARLLAKEIGANDAALSAEDDAADVLSNEIMARVLAKTILLDWEGFTYQKKPVDNSEASRVRALLVKDFRGEIMELSKKIEHFKAKYEEEQGNA